MIVKDFSLNRTTLSMLILVALVALVGWLILTPTADLPAGNAPRLPSPVLQTAPNNPDPTTGGG